MIAVVGRLVPHKQVEHAIDAGARAARASHPDLRLHVVGQRAGGRPSCTTYAAARGAGDTVVFEGHVDETPQARDLRAGRGCWRCPRSRRAGAWWSARPACTAPRRWPTARPAAPGSPIADGASGLLVDDADRVHRRARPAAAATTRSARRLGDGARAMSHRFTWEHAQESFAHVVASALRGERIDSQDPDEE